MKFVYKIHSGYDGFTPARIPDRMNAERELTLGWKRYIDSVEAGDEIWVYFRGPHRFENGVYVQGVAKTVRYDREEVVLSVSEHSTAAPLTDPALSRQIATVVDIRYRQVFVLPEELDIVPDCTATTTATSCRARQCDSCPTWNSLTPVDRRTLNMPHRLAGRVDGYAPAFWSVARRSFLFHGNRRIRRGVRASTELFGRFKLGEQALAYPLALGMRNALAKAHRLDADGIVPVPLSPDKADAGELNRTAVLAEELSRLIGVPVRPWLTLTRPISKRRLRTGLGYTAAQFERSYGAALHADPRLAGMSRVLLLDDVCTEGSTVRECVGAILAVNPDAVIVATTAAQMTIRKAVADESSLLD